MVELCANIGRVLVDCGIQLLVCNRALEIVLGAILQDFKVVRAYNTLPGVGSVLQRVCVCVCVCVCVRACASGSMVNTNALLRITLLACYLCGIGQCKMFRNASCHAFDNQGMRRDLGSIG
jgi:hypothetical protein